MNQILEQLGTYGIVPVVVLQDAAKAEPADGKKYND